MTSSLLSEIGKWKLDAREEVTQRYFFAVDGLGNLRDGTKSYVIGRKGTGKTAIAEHVFQEAAPKVFTTMLSFKSFPFKSIYAHADERFTRPNQYTTLWRHVLYSAICNMMGGNQSLDVASALKKIFNLDLESALGQSIAKITNRGFNLGVLGTGAGIGPKQTALPHTASWLQRTDSLEEFIKGHIDNSAYFILLDELDEDYKLTFNLTASTYYFDLITGLFKAVQYIRRSFQMEGICVYPLVFLRDDIFDRIRDPDKNKWSDAVLELDWDDVAIKQLMHHRICQARDDTAPFLSDADPWGEVFSMKKVRYGSSKQYRRSVYAHIKRNTLMRPRDFISYVRCCAQQAVRAGHDLVSAGDLKKADELHSEYFRQEFIDEVHPVLPEIASMFDILSGMRQTLVDIEKFKSAYFHHFQDAATRPNVDSVLDILFEFSIIGNQPRQTNREVFKYLNKRAFLNRNEKICIHRALIKALAIY